MKKFVLLIYIFLSFENSKYCGNFLILNIRRLFFVVFMKVIFVLFFVIFVDWKEDSD